MFTVEINNNNKAFTLFLNLTLIGNNNEAGMVRDRLWKASI